MTPDELEFNICQYLDGTLADEQRAALEALFTHDKNAQQLLAEHRKLNAAMKGLSPVPELPWDQLADRFAKVVATDSEQLEHAVVQYVDGDLAAEQRTALEQRLADDTHGTMLLKQHERLHSALRRLPLPRIHWKNLTAHLTDAVDELANPAPIKLFGPWMRTIGSLAVAACVLLASGIMVHQRFGSHEIHGPTHEPMAISTNFQPDAPSGPAMTDISIGAGANAVSASSTQYADGIVGVQRSRGLIATQSGSEQDIPLY